MSRSRMSTSMSKNRKKRERREVTNKTECRQMRQIEVEGRREKKIFYLG